MVNYVELMMKIFYFGEEMDVGEFILVIERGMIERGNKVVK